MRLTKTQIRDLVREVQRARRLRYLRYLETSRATKRAARLGDLEAWRIIQKLYEMERRI